MEEQSYWRKCNSCKNEIPFNGKYYECSVSTCTRKRTGLVFCCVSCWERHLPTARHRDAAAIERSAPSKNEWIAEMSHSEQITTDEPSTGVRRIVGGQTPHSAHQKSSTYSDEILIIASRLKNYVKQKSDMNTSEQVLVILSNMIRIECDRAIDNARSNGRKTLLDRDFKS